MAQGRFIVGASHRSKPMWSRGKNSWSYQHFPQVPSNELSPAKQVKVPWAQGIISLSHSAWMPGSLFGSDQPNWIGTDWPKAVGLDIYPCLPPGKIWHKVFFIVGFRGGGGRVRADTRALLDNAIESFSVMWTTLAFAKSLGTKPDDLAGHRFSRSKSLVQCEYILAFV